MTTWTQVSKSNTGISEVDFLFSDGTDFLFSDSTDFVFVEGTNTIVWNTPSRNSASWASPSKS